jgi:hypothetical protein
MTKEIFDMETGSDFSARDGIENLCGALKRSYIEEWLSAVPQGELQDPFSWRWSVDQQQLQHDPRLKWLDGQSKG